MYNVCVSDKICFLIYNIKCVLYSFFTDISTHLEWDHSCGISMFSGSLSLRYGTSLDWGCSRRTPNVEVNCEFIE